MTKKRDRIIETPNGMVEMLIDATCCRDVLGEYFADYWLDQYIWRVGCDQEMAEKAKEFLVYALTFILNELKSLTKEEIVAYIYSPDKLLEELISCGEKRAWTLDKHSAVGLCAYIIEDYIFDTGKLQYNSNASESALEQIVVNYPDKVFTDICDPAWEKYYDNLLYEHREDEDAVCVCHNLQALEKAVRMRECMPAELTKHIFNR